MSTKSKNIKSGFQDILNFEDRSSRLEHDSKIIMFKFLSHVENEMLHRNMTKRELADELGISASFVTQLFRGSKTINLLTLAKIQEIFGIEFSISAISGTKSSTIKQKVIHQSGKSEQVIVVQ